MRKTVLITGCSSGFGLLAAERFAREGWRVIATMRDPSRGGQLPPEVEAAALDVTSEQSIEQAVANSGPIDVLVNNAGRGYFAFLEETDLDAAREMFEVNVLGLVRVTQAVLPIMRSQGHGRIVNMSSVAGEFAYPRNGLYSASKHAVEAISEALYYEVRHLGIQVVVVQPGLFVTGFAERAGQGAGEKDLEPAYLPVLADVRRRRARLAEQGQDPAAVGEMVFRAATEEPPQFRYPVGPDAVELLARRREMGDQEWMEMVARLGDVKEGR